ncbi:hypothetical protein [Vibrio sp. HN007]|uniref:hypothetical protein n=1 Tax=Vibrio iocasae TaxID=3098914 RepID=UPI0035D421BA
MLNVIVILLALVIAAIYGAYYYRVNKRKKASQAILNKRLASVDRIKSGFKSDLQRLTDLGVMSERAHNLIYSLALYYFVFQPATDESIEQCENTLKSFLMVIRDKMQDTEHNNPVFIRLHLDEFADGLPRKVDGYNKRFYNKKLPILIKHLEEAQGIVRQENDII